MTDTPLAVKLLAEQRRRCVASILGQAEDTSWWAKLSTTQQEAYRDQVRLNVRIFYDFTRDLIKVSDEGSVRNEAALELLRSIHANQSHLAKLITGGPA